MSRAESRRLRGTTCKPMAAGSGARLREIEVDGSLERGRRFARTFERGPASRSPSPAVPARAGSQAPALAGPGEERAPADWLAALLRGEGRSVPFQSRLALQVAALEHVAETFPDDGELRAAVDEKLGAMPEARLDRFFEEQPDGDRQALRCLLAAFEEPYGDQRLRLAVLGKLAAVGDRDDALVALRSSIAGTPADVWHGMNTGEQIVARWNAPPRRSLVETRALQCASDELQRRYPDLAKIEAALKDGRVVARFQGPAEGHAYPVEFLTLDAQHRRADGSTARVAGVFKPEPSWPNKPKFFATREAATYALDRSFLGTGLVPPTVVTFRATATPLEGRAGACLGSLQYKVEGEQLGGGACWDWKQEFADLLKDRRFVKQLAAGRVLVYIANDPDKFRSNVKPVSNFNNMMVDARKELNFIDNAGAFGGNQGQWPHPDEPVHKDVLPHQQDRDLVERIRRIDPELVKAEMSPWVGAEQAAEVATRVKVAADELRARPTSRPEPSQRSRSPGRTF